MEADLAKMSSEELEHHLAQLDHDAYVVVLRGAVDSRNELLAVRVLRARPERPLSGSVLSELLDDAIEAGQPVLCHLLFERGAAARLESLERAIAARQEAVAIEVLTRSTLSDKDIAQALRCLADTEWGETLRYRMTELLDERRGAGAVASGGIVEGPKSHLEERARGVPHRMQGR